MVDFESFFFFFFFFFQFLNCIFFKICIVMKLLKYRPMFPKYVLNINFYNDLHMSNAIVQTVQHK